MSQTGEPQVGPPARRRSNRPVKPAPQRTCIGCRTVMAKRQLVRLLGEWRAAGAAIVLVTHDVELAAEIADRVAVLSQGEVIAEGAPAQVLAASPWFAPQISRLFPDTGWLTVSDVLNAAQ